MDSPHEGVADHADTEDRWSTVSHRYSLLPLDLAVTVVRTQTRSAGSRPRSPW
jgi:hypothetical protein